LFGGFCGWMGMEFAFICVCVVSLGYVCFVVVLRFEF